MATEWYYQGSGSTNIGPLSNAELLEHVRAGFVDESTLVRKDDSKWVAAREINGLMEAAKKPARVDACPYCETPVNPAPTRCPKCDRQLLRTVKKKVDNSVVRKRVLAGTGPVPNAAGSPGMLQWLRSFWRDEKKADSNQP